MKTNDNWFEILKFKEHLYIIREKLKEIEPRFLTEYINLYLILASQKALLIDTGCGLFPIKPITDGLIGERELIVLFCPLN